MLVSSPVTCCSWMHCTRVHWYAGNTTSRAVTVHCCSVNMTSELKINLKRALRSTCSTTVAWFFSTKLLMHAAWFDKHILISKTPQAHKKTKLKTLQTDKRSRNLAKSRIIKRPLGSNRNIPTKKAKWQQSFTDNTIQTKQRIKSSNNNKNTHRWWGYMI